MADSGVIKFDEGLIQRVIESGIRNTGIRYKTRNPVHTGGPSGRLPFRSAEYIQKDSAGILKLSVSPGNNSIHANISNSTAVPSSQAGNFVRGASEAADAGKWKTTQGVLNNLFSGGDFKNIINRLISERISTSVDTTGASVTAEKAGSEAEK